MLWETIKKVLQKQGGTCIIVEDGRPVYVVTNFNEYEKLIDAKNEANTAGKISMSSSEQEILEKINQEIENWKPAQVETQAAQELEEEENEVKIEDLPV